MGSLLFLRIFCATRQLEVGLETQRIRAQLLLLQREARLSDADNGPDNPSPKKPRGPGEIAMRPSITNWKDKSEIHVTSGRG
ncbi:hypothetical protein VUR80DRAFT_9251 [Thermomyces stellatus]